nr:hypothetical protein [uncultured Chryseobacterium sp.]
MKNLLKSIIAILFVLNSCQDDSDAVQKIGDKISVETNANAAKTFASPEEFVNSVALLQQGGFEDRLNPEKTFLLMEIKDFSGNIQLNEAYQIKGIEYNDNGKFNDKVANDGIYTSVESFKIKNKEEVLNSFIVNKAESFKYETALSEYMTDVNGKRSIKFGCKVRNIKCPQTSWYNTCIWGSSCTCVDFYDCDISVEFEF